MTRGAKWLLGVALVGCLAFSGMVAAVIYLAVEYNRGGRLLGEGYEATHDINYDVAVRKFDQALNRRLRPANASFGYAYRAYCFYFLNRVDEALRDVNEALRLNGELTWAYELRGLLHLDLSEKEKAFADFTETLQRDPNSLGALLPRASLALERNDVESAIRDLKEAVRLQREDPELYLRLGEAQLHRDDLASALASFESAIRRNPQHADGYSKRAEVYRRQERPDAATADETKAAELRQSTRAAYDPFTRNTISGARAHRLMLDGRAALDTERHELAISLYEQALQHSLSTANASVAHMNIGCAYYAQGDMEKAWEKFHEAIHKDRLNVLAYINRGDVYLREGDLDLAIEDADRALVLEPENGHAHMLRGICFRRLGENARAVADLQRAIALKSPRSAVAWNELAWLRATTEEEAFQDGKEAVAAAERACELSEWKNAGFMETLAAAHAANGNFEKAVEVQTSAIEKAGGDGPERQEAEERLATYRAGKPHRARRLSQEASTEGR